MPSGGRGCAPPKSAQWVVSHYQIGFKHPAESEVCPILSRHAYDCTGLPPAGAAVGVSHVVVCAVVRNAGAKLV